MLFDGDSAGLAFDAGDWEYDPGRRVASCVSVIVEKSFEGTRGGALGVGSEGAVVDSGTRNNELGIEDVSLIVRYFLKNIG